MKQTIQVPIPTYPWTPVVSPLLTAFDDEEVRWLQEDYNFLTAEALARYKRQHIVTFALYMSPTTTNVDQLRPVIRWGLFHTIFDDYVGIMPLDELQAIRDRVCEVMIGEDPDPDEIGMLHQMARARKEWLANGMPQFWIERMVKDFHEYVTFGAMEETPFKLNNSYPSLGRYLLIRSYSIGQIAYVNLIEPATGFAIPAHIHDHPVIQRLKALQSIIIGIQNDIASLRKELATKHETFNIVLILHHERGLSLAEAIVESLKIHDKLVDELESISICLPNFGPYQEEVENYVYHIKLMITCLNTWYYQSGTSRYAQEGFITPKYGKEGEMQSDLEIRHISQEPLE